MKIGYENRTYTLKAESIDLISEQIADFIDGLKVERYNAIGIRLTLEEALLRWRDHFGSDAVISYSTGMSLGKPFIRFGLEGDQYDPLSDSDNDYGYWVDSLMKNMGMNPVYTYSGNENVVMIKLPRPEADPAKVLISSVIIGLAAGILTRLLIPDEALLSFAASYLDPVQEVFFRLLNVASIPLIFLSVLSVSCGAGNVAARGKDNRKMILHFILITVLFTVFAAGVSALAFGMDPGSVVSEGSRILTVFRDIISIVPTDIMTPFQAGNSPQLIFMALVLGNALLMAGHQAENLIKIVDEAYHVILMVADWVSMVTPFFVVLLLVLGVWSGTLLSIAGLWKPLACFAVTTQIMLMCAVVFVSRVKHVDLKKLYEKMKGPFITAFRHSSVNAAYGENYNCCVNQLGINKHFADNAIPLGLVLFQPAATMGMVLFSFYMATVYNVETSFIWMASTLALAVALQIASPPVSGVNLLAYAAIFSKMGIPDEALILAMVADIIFCFISSAADQAMLQYELIMEADRTGRLDIDKLRK
ncbi:MAG: cation:dicarboxylase symporter family transporter [Eubacterium sp.]|nr:cation:dicarboxylase symporter family transporter [Eubacterium sp.]